MFAGWTRLGDEAAFPTETLVAGVFGGLMCFYAAPLMIRSRRLPKLAARFPWLDPRRQRPWTRLILCYFGLAVLARQVSLGIIYGSAWRAAWGVEVGGVFIVLGLSQWGFQKRALLDGTYAITVEVALASAQSPEGHPALAGFGRRLVARVIDVSIIFVAGLSIAGPLAGDETRPGFWVTVTVGILTLWALVEIVMVAVRGQTPGKIMMGIIVSMTEEGARPSWGRSVIRWVALVILTVAWPFGVISGLSILWNKRRQSWSDRAAGTLVLATGHASSLLELPRLPS